MGSFVVRAEVGMRCAQGGGGLGGGYKRRLPVPRAGGRGRGSMVIWWTKGGPTEANTGRWRGLGFLAAILLTTGVRPFTFLRGLQAEPGAGCAARALPPIHI